MHPRWCAWWPTPSAATILDTALDLAETGGWERLYLHDVATALNCDLAAIAQVQDALEESEDGESDYMEVMEYLRVAPLLLFTETKKTAEAAPAKPSLH